MTSVERRLFDLEARVAELERARWMRSPRPSRHRAEEIFGVSWLNGLGAALVLAGIVSASAWLHDVGYVTPLVRNGVLLAAAVAVFAAGVRALRSASPARRRFGNGLAGVGALGLYVVPFAASKVDALIGIELASGSSTAARSAAEIGCTSASCELSDDMVKLMTT